MSVVLKDPSLFRRDCFVGGEWIESKSKARFAVTDPATTTEIASCPECSKEDAIRAIETARHAFPAFRKTRPLQRAQWLRKWYDLMLEHIDDLAKIITLENGKPLADARGEVTYAAGFLDWFSGEAPRIYGDTIQASNPDNRVLTLKQPIGVCALITPWNFPAAMITRKAGPAIAAGCTVVVKAAGETPLTALALAELAQRAGIPAGVFNVVTALENTIEIGRVLTTHPLVKKVSFTGSTAVGSLLMQQSATTLKKMSLELGGNAPFIVFDDANLDAAVDGLMTAKFRLTGQTCVCANRIFVHRKVHDEFVSKFVERVRALRVGPGMDPNSTHGPLVHERAVQKVDSHVRDALDQGAKLVFGGTTLPHLGPNFFNITVLTGMRAGMKIFHEETFGPIAAIFAFETEKEAIDTANQSDVGLAGYFYSKDSSRCWRVAEALEVGMVGVNSGLVADWVAPFGGVKQSGFGREGSKYGIDEFLAMKTVVTSVEAA